MNEVIVTPDGIRWEIYGLHVVAVDDETCETVGDFWMSDSAVLSVWLDDEEDSDDTP